MRKLIGTIVVLIVLVAGLGYYRGWFSISRTDAPGSDDVGVGVSIDRSKAKGDVAQAGEKLRDLTRRGKEEIKSAAGSDERPSSSDEMPAEGVATAAGKIVSIEPAGSLTVETDDGRSLQIEVPVAAGVTVDGRDATTAALRSGDQIVVHYESAEGKNVARDLSVTTRPS